MMFLRNWKIIVGLAVFASIALILFFWRSDIIKGTENAYRAITNEKTIEANIQSKKEADNVRREVQALDSRARARELCALGIVYESKGCNSQ